MFSLLVAGAMHGLSQMSFWILVVNAAGPCKTLSSLLTVMILLPLLGGEEESVEEGCPDWDNNCRTPGKERLNKYKRTEEKSWKGQEEPVLGGTEEGVATEAATPLDLLQQVHSLLIVVASGLDVVF